MRRWLPRNRALRTLAVVAMGVVALELLYLVVANIALAVIAKRFADNEPVGVAFDRGMTWFPGRVHLRGVRVKGAGWSVAMSDADVVTALTHVDSITADVTSVELDAKEGRRSKGMIHVVVSDLAVEDQRVAFRADAKVEDATLEHGAVVLANGVHGSIKLTVASVDLSHHSILDTMSGSVALDGAFLSLEPLSSFASLTTTQDHGTLHAAGTLHAGALEPASEIRAHTGKASLADAHGAHADFPRGLDVLVRVNPSTATEMQLAVQTPSLVFAGADASKPADVFDDFELTVPAGDSDLKKNHFVMRSLAWSSTHARVHEGATTLSANAHGTLHFELGHDDELVANTGDITATNVTVENADAPDHAPFDARLSIERLAISRAEGIFLRGPMHASGDDVRPLVEVLVTSPSIRQTLGPLARQPFTLDTTMRRSNQKLTLDDFNLHAGKLTLRGGYRRHDTTSSGAFLLENGPLPAGIVMHDKTESLVLGASPAWLERQLAE